MEINQHKTSYSALQTFKQCPQKYKFQHIDKIKAPKSKEAVFGSKIHKALKFFHSQYPLSPTLDELLNYYKDIWDSQPFQSEEEDMIFFSEGIKMLKNYYQYFLKNQNNFIVLDTESRFEVTIEHPQTNQKKCTLVGKIDRIDKHKDGTIEIIDYKTAKRLPSQTEVDNDLQFSIYCLAVFLRWPHLKIKKSEDIKLSFYYLRHGEILTTQRTEKQLKEVKNKVWQEISEIEKGNFKPIPSALCDWCGYKEICPMWKHKFDKKLITNQEIQTAIKDFLKFKNQNAANNQKLKELKQIINDYLDQNGLERVFDEEMGYITRLNQIRKGSYNIKKLEKIIKTLPPPIRKKIEKTKEEDKEYTILKATLKKKKQT